MELLKTIVLVLGTGFLLTSCLPEEEPIDPQDRGGVSLVQIEMGSSYTNQVWFDLTKQEAVKTVNRFSYDLIYDPSLPVAPIELNSARISSIAATSVSTFAEPINPSELTFEESDPNGKADSSAFSKIGFRLGDIYVIKLGVNEQGNQAGYVKIRLFENNESGGFTLEHAQLNAASPILLELPSLANAEQRAILFKENTILNIFPRHDEYDLLFTNYTHLFYEQNLTYSVTGVLLNLSNVRAYELNNGLEFENVSKSSIDSDSWSLDQDEIGYDWKNFSLETNNFSVDASRIFAVKDRYGYQYKMRFIDFYNAQGEKGYPLFELEGL